MAFLAAYLPQVWFNSQLKPATTGVADNGGNMRQLDGPRLIVAMDYDNAEDCLTIAHQLSPQDCRLKVGKELFTTSGPQLVEQLMTLGFDVFLDLKFHDIPNTTAKAVAAAANLGVWMVNVHASGGRRMMEAACDALAPFSNKPLLIGVTVLTSMESQDLADIGIDSEPEAQVLKLASLAKSSGLDGVVCSALEASALKRKCGEDFSLVTPGIRPASAAKNDQRRIMTPAEAVGAGSDYLVVGRPVTQAGDPSQACRAILSELP